MKNPLLLIGPLIFLCSCAARYSYINPSRIRYPDIQVRDTAVVLQYKYEVLRDSDNKKYAKKEPKFNVNLVAVKITNNTDSIVNTDQLEFSSGGNYMRPLSPEMTKKMLRQKGEFHLFYLLLTPMRFYSGTSSTPVGLVIGPGLALLNMGIASSANKDLFKDLKKYSLHNRPIGPGQSIYGLAGFPNDSGEPIYVIIKKKN